MDQLPYLERVQIQIEILLPFYTRIRAEIGEERAAELLREAEDEYGLAMGNAVADAMPGTSLDKLRGLMPVMAANGALTVEPLVDNENEFSMNVRECKYADFFQELGESRFGSMITCDFDPSLTQGVGDDLTFSRSQTIMKGGSQCDFCWKLG